MTASDRLAQLLQELGEGASKLDDAPRLLEPLTSLLVPAFATDPNADWRERRALAVSVRLCAGLADDSPELQALAWTWRRNADVVPDWDERGGGGPTDAGQEPLPAVDSAAASRLLQVDALLDELRQERVAAGAHELRGHVSFDTLQWLLLSPLVERCSPLTLWWPTGDAPAGAPR